MAFDWLKALEIGATIGGTVYSAQQMKEIYENMPTSSDVLKDTMGFYNDPANRAGLSDMARWQAQESADLSRIGVGNYLETANLFGKDIDKLNVDSRNRMNTGNLQALMGAAYDPSKSAAENIASIDRNTNPELYAAAQRMGGRQYNDHQLLGGLSGTAAQAGSGLNDYMSAQAMRGLMNNGQLSARDQRDAQEMSRSAYNDRGRVRDSGAVVGELVANENLQRQRREEARNYAFNAEGNNQRYGLANAGFTNDMTRTNIDTANQRDIYNTQLRQQDFSNRMNLDQSAYNAYAGLRQDPYSAYMNQQSPNVLSTQGVYQSGGAQGAAGQFGVGDAFSLNNALTGMNTNARIAGANAQADIYGGGLSAIGSILGSPQRP